MEQFQEGMFSCFFKDVHLNSPAYSSTIVAFRLCQSDLRSFSSVLQVRFFSNHFFYRYSEISNAISHLVRLVDVTLKL